MTSHNNTHKASLHLAHGYCSSKMNERGNVMLSGKFQFTLVTSADDSPETHREQVVMRGIDTMHKRLRECACTEDWLGMLDCKVCPTSGLNTHTANVHSKYGHCSDTMQESGDIMISVDFDFMLVTAADETPEPHREQVTRVIDELHKTLKECTCAPDFWKANVDSLEDT